MILAEFFIPHGHCYLWKPKLVGLHLVSDGLITIAYYSIPLLLIIFLRQRQDIPFNGIFQLFSAFILACGTTHLMEIWTLWYPTYWLSGGIKLITAVISLITAVVLIRSLPQALTLPSPAQLAQINQQLTQEIQQRQQTEVILRDREQRFRAMFDQSFQFIGLLTPKGILLEANQTALDFGGLSPVDVVNRPFWETPWWVDVETLHATSLHPGGFGTSPKQEQLKEAIAKAAAGEFVRYEVEVQGRDSQMITIDFSLKPVHDDTGNVVLLIPEGRDITARKQIEAQLMESEQRFRCAFKDAPIGIALVAPDGQFIKVNRALCEIVGYSEAELLTRTFQHITHPDDLRADLAYVNRMLAGEIRTYQMEKRYFHRIGHEVWILLSVSLVRNIDEEPLYFIAQIQDITERKQAEHLKENYKRTLEAEVAQRTQALQKSEASYRRLIETAYEGIWIIDEQGNTTFTNPRMVQMLGYSVEEMMGKPLFAFMDEEGKTIASQNLERRRRGINEQHDFKFCCKDGSELWVIISTTAIFDAAGNYTGALGMITDISDRKQAEIKLQEALDAAESANRAKSQFLANMSHELRTPLNAILGFTQLLNRDPNCTASQQEKLDIINQSGEHLLGLINEILDMSKIEVGITQLNPQSFDLYELLDSLADLLKVKAKAKGLLLHVERDSAVPKYVQMDEKKLRQVLMNLIDNAIKFTDSGSVTLSIKAKNNQGKMTHNQGQITFKISDTGKGIAANEMDTLFDAFAQTETGRNSHEGTGLGLAISQRFVELMGGEITVKSQLGKGTTFTFDVDVTLTDASTIQPASSPKQVIGLAPDQPKYRILIADDRWESRYLLVQLLELIGFEVKEADNGEEAIALWQEWHPHLVLMDMRMPVMNGYEATQQIKASLKGQATTIIAITASAFEEERSLILSAGCDDFIRKPFQESILFDKIALHLGVQYIYEDVPDSETISSVQTFEELTKEALLIMSSEWLSQLHHAALSGDGDEILSLINQIPESYTTLKITLADLVENFQLEPIIDLTEAFTDV